MDKTKDSPVPDRTSQAGGKGQFEKQAQPDRQATEDPKFVRGVANPTTKKER